MLLFRLPGELLIAGKCQHSVGQILDRFVWIALFLALHITVNKVIISFNKSRFPQHLIYTAIPNFPARLSIVVDTQVEIDVSG